MTYKKYKQISAIFFNRSILSILQPRMKCIGIMKMKQCLFMSPNHINNDNIIKLLEKNQINMFSVPIKMCI